MTVKFLTRTLCLYVCVCVFVCVCVCVCESGVLNSQNVTKQWTLLCGLHYTAALPSLTLEQEPKIRKSRFISTRRLSGKLKTFTWLTWRWLVHLPAYHKVLDLIPFWWGSFLELNSMKVDSASRTWYWRCL